MIGTNWNPSGQCLSTEGIHRSDWIQTSSFMGKGEVVVGEGGDVNRTAMSESGKIAVFSWGSCIAENWQYICRGICIVWPDYTVVEWIESGFVSNLFTFAFIYFYSIACRNFNNANYKLIMSVQLKRDFNLFQVSNATVATTATASKNSTSGSQVRWCVECVCILCFLTDDYQ